ncbi:tetrahydromethanopterin S-methyltransferase, subunit C [Methanospirillum hungatei JF-1]|jgi:tetrahydromethanopterin S-methyltransferase, subunit C (EC 2.1.1.86)|uniref:Tetrahydromethanopterin S-methyltransferase subunit C n=1 Tax=Methanospirillum hungatei JF-1 (strain ATCC 27890 / DSM 864 / NBRC 100397 / JF-1) TaxID=323259 RepID=Q2FRN4_METHJ|nr:tetrahydromethanopterin S-methyltransferase subunit C [Methanospirillum hungatei]MBP7035003.1 tetrahydromethanopterin S-methyltransferase subunit C [Methanospirillum sp.]OQA60708.1 MAG: Tetrahydromethanopterin S-methyltransferase subunit C [Euryarchaeota archaeon ADurb.Bin294]ABD41875.1 tetrahydromethanopterin S-methyltransferase, subunit C [Methanospirillum hungatei JF-1]MBP9007141.1 tetrahydromethanopterin S-methyltransferase subunit C [Methanospirillum sp.]HOW03609.1 tetrahydromethanopte
MTAKMEASAGAISENTLMIYGIVVALVGTYLTYLNVVTGMAVFSFFGGIGAIAAIWWGSDTIKHLCSYGLGTGVPSAGMVAFGAGAIAMIAGTKFGIASPIVTLILAAIIGAVIGYIANNVINMNIPVMIFSLMKLSIVGALTMLGFAAMCTGTFMFNGLVIGGMTLSMEPAGEAAAGGAQTFMVTVLPEFAGSLIGGSALAVIFFLGAMALQHPFNACLGPNESQDRTLMLAIEVGFLSMFVVAVISYAFLDMMAATVGLIISLIGWIYTYKQYIALSKRDAYAWLDAKPIIEVGGHE